MLKERCYTFGAEACIPDRALHVFTLGVGDRDYCHCGKHQLGYYESRYIEVPVGETGDAPQAVELRRLDAALTTLDNLRQSEYTITFNRNGVTVTATGSLVARGEGTSADCLRQLAGQLRA